MLKLLGKLAPLVVLGSIAFLIWNRSLVSASPWVIAGQVSALALTVWARRCFRSEQFRTGAAPGEGGLVESGPYRVIRHPMYAGALLLIWSSVLGHWSPINALVGVVVTAFATGRIVFEEQLILARYPAYAEYRRRTKRVVPYLI